MKIPIPSLDGALLAAKLALLAGAVLLGWVARGWKSDSDELIAQKAAAKTVEVFRGHETAIAATLEDRLSKLRANRTIVEKERETIVDRPVYRNVCLDDDGLRLIEAARTGSHPGEPAGQVPRAPE